MTATQEFWFISRDFPYDVREWIARTQYGRPFEKATIFVRADFGQTGMVSLAVTRCDRHGEQPR